MKPIVFRTAIHKQWFILGPDIHLAGPFPSWCEAIRTATEWARTNRAAVETINRLRAEEGAQ